MILFMSDTGRFDEGCRIIKSKVVKSHQSLMPLNWTESQNLGLFLGFGTIKLKLSLETGHFQPWPEGMRNVASCLNILNKPGLLCSILKYKIDIHKYMSFSRIGQK